ncbi:hypothetical protein BaRGS_00017755, partial [Batillaria attramentaria]
EFSEPKCITCVREIDRSLGQAHRERMPDYRLAGIRQSEAILGSQSAPTARARPTTPERASSCSAADKEEEEDKPMAIGKGMEQVGAAGMTCLSSEIMTEAHLGGCLRSSLRSIVS